MVATELFSDYDPMSKELAKVPSPWSHANLVQSYIGDGQKNENMEEKAQNLGLRARESS